MLPAKKARRQGLFAALCLSKIQGAEQMPYMGTRKSEWSVNCQTTGDDSPSRSLQQIQQSTEGSDAYG